MRQISNAAGDQYRGPPISGELAPAAVVAQERARLAQFEDTNIKITAQRQELLLQ